ncbi:MAG TPA: phosphoribosyltransferase [Thermoanaerobaculia bacterium]|nr:phosphoribosyltransferase [Thermoanaerobaculia bacterium]
MRRYRNRTEAGRLLAELLRARGPLKDPIVLALPRGGVPVAAPIAEALGAPLDVFIVRKLGVPGHEELAMGAIASGGVRVVNRDVVDSLGISEAAIDRVAMREEAEMRRREKEYRGERPPLDVRGKTVIVVDDGLATGSTMRAAVQALRNAGAGAIIVAVPVAAASTCASLRREVDDLVCGMTPEPFLAVGMWYDDFEQTTDAEVRALLDSLRTAGT